MTTFLAEGRVRELQARLEALRGEEAKLLAGLLSLVQQAVQVRPTTAARAVQATLLGGAPERTQRPAWLRDRGPTRAPPAPPPTLTAASTATHSHCITLPCPAGRRRRRRPSGRSGAARTAGGGAR